MAKNWIYSVLVLAFCGIAGVAAAQETAVSLYNTGLEKLKAKNFKEALPLLEQAISKADSTSETDQKVVKLAQRNGSIAAYYLGTDQRKDEKLDDALGTFEKGIGLDSSFYANYIGRAQVLEDQDKDAQAVRAYLMAAHAAQKSKKDDKVDDLVSKAGNIAAVNWGKKNWDKAIASAKAFLEEKETADIHYYLGQALMEKKQYDEAIEHGKKAAELATGEDKDKSYYGLGEIYEAAGQKDNAIAAYKNVSGSKYGERAKYKVTQLGGSK